MSRLRAVALVALLLSGAGLVGSRVGAVDSATRESLRLFTELVSVEHERYGAEVSYRDLIYSSTSGMLRPLDPHTAFLSPEAYADMRSKNQSSFYGIGVLISVRNGQLTVISPVEGGPAARLGIQAGDVISTVEGEPTETMSLDEAIDRLKGPKGTEVKVTVVRRGLDEPLAMTIVRAEVAQTTVRQAYMLTPETGYVQLTSFARGTGREISDALAKLKARGMKQLLLDLRNNGGGLLDQAIDVSDQFLPQGLSVVETRGRIADSKELFRTAGKHPELGLPVVVLVNEGTASASEILSGAIQDHDFGLVVGEPTWGKGLVQTVFNLSYGAGLALTTSKYFTPSGRLIQRDYSSYFDYYAHADAGSPEVTGKPVDPSQLFKTDLGRKVYGGGGITPDVVVKDTELPPFVTFLLARNAYSNFAVDYQRRSPVKSVDWQPSPAVLDEFRSWLLAEKLASAAEIDEGFAKEGGQVGSLLQIRGEVLNVAFGQEARHRAITAGDVQLQAGLGLFGRAAELLAQRRAQPVVAQAADLESRSVAGADRVAALEGSFRLAAAAPAPASAGAAEDSLYKSLAMFSEALGLVQTAYVDEPDTEALMASAVEGSTDALDPFSTYIPAAHAAGYLEARTRAMRQSGVLLLKEHGVPYVVAVESGSPAGAAGVEPGDVVARIAGRPTHTIALWEIQEQLAAEAGTKVDLELFRRGEARSVSLVLAPFAPPAPTLSTAEGAAMLRIPTFDAGTASAIESLLAKAGDAAKAGLLVDLRGVFTGDPEAAYAAAELFVDGELGSLRARGADLQTWKAGRKPIWRGRLVVLVDRGTLGAAEILASVLRQQAKAELVGERTFGHAGRQAWADLAAGGRLLYTDAFYTGPDRAPIRDGLAPDVKVDERSRTLLDKDVPMRELILKRGVGRLLRPEGDARRKAA